MKKRGKVLATGEIMVTGYMSFRDDGALNSGFSFQPLLRGDIRVHIIRADEPKGRGKR